MTSPTPPSSRARPLSETWTLEDTRAWLLVQDERPTPLPFKDETFETRALYQKAYDVWMETKCRPLLWRKTHALAEHLRWLAQEGALAEPSHAEQSASRWLHVLRALLENPATPLDKHQAHTLIGPWDMEIALLATRTELSADKTGVSLHNALQHLMHEGSFAFPSLHDALTCYNTGKSLALQVKNWQFQLGTVQYTNDHKSVFTPITPTCLPAPRLHQVTLPVPSGEIWVNDWFRFEAFTQKTKALDSHKPEDSINFLEGCVRQTTRYAEEMGFLSVMVGNTCPAVSLQAGRIEIGSLWGEEDEEEDEYDEEEETLSAPKTQAPVSLPSCDAAPPTPSTRLELGHVCTDLWWATLIDRQVLEDHLAPTMGREAAQEAMVAYQKANAHVLTVVNVPPGTYHAYFAGNPSIFATRFHAEGVDLSAFTPPMLVVSPTPLVLKEKPVVPSTKESASQPSSPKRRP